MKQVVNAEQAKGGYGGSRSECAAIMGKMQFNKSLLV